MKKIIGFLFVALVMYACDVAKHKDNTIETETYIEGELVFKLIDIGNYYGLPDSIVHQFEYYIDSVSHTKNVSKADQQFIDYFLLLEKNDILNVPYFTLKIDSTQLVKVFLSETEYSKIEKYDRQSLVNEKMKVIVKLKGEFLPEDIVKCQQIISTRKVKGKTFWRK